MTDVHHIGVVGGGAWGTALASLDACDAILLACPAQAVRTVAAGLPGTSPVVICAKGLETASGLLMPEVLAEVMPDRPFAMLSGPSFAEMARLGNAMGARVETLTGLAGLGDLVLTCHGPLSRNRSLGVALGKGMTLQAYMEGRRQVVEGAATAPAVLARAARLGIEMPICAAVDAILHRDADLDDAIRALLARPLRREGE